ncbi:MAG: Trk system potassium transporter TrkA [Magnetococcus sp. WYHC-3]
MVLSVGGSRVIHALPEPCHTMHIIIVGAGRIGSDLARYLSEAGLNVVLIEADARVVQQAQERMDVQVLQGEGTDLNLLLEAGLKKSSLVLAVTSSDETNIVITLIAQAQAPDAHVIARVRGSQFTTNPDLWTGKALNETILISPDQAACEMLHHLVEVEHAFEVMPFLGGAIRMVGFPVETGSPLVGRAIMEFGQQWRELKALVMAINRRGHMLVPRGHQSFEVGDRIYLSTITAKDAAPLLRFLGHAPTRERRVVIVGGSSLGARMAQELLARNTPVTLVERDERICQSLAARMPGATILLGNAREGEILGEIITDRTTFLALTGTEEVNFLVAMMARRLGACQTIALMDNSAYIAMAREAGIDAVVSPKQAAVGTILRFVRKGKVLDAAPLLDGQLEVLVTEIQPGSLLDGVALRQAEIPRDVLVGAVVQGGVAAIPDGNTVLHPGDAALLLAPRRRLARVESLLARSRG